MTEAEFTNPIVAYLRDNGCIAFKHCDRFTTSIPDVTATAMGFTTWLEMKVLKKGENALDRVMEDKLQFFHMTGLAAAGRASYVIRGNDGNTWLYPPGYFLRIQQAITQPDDPVPLGKENYSPQSMLHLNRNLIPAILAPLNYQPILALVRATQ